MCLQLRIRRQRVRSEIRSFVPTLPQKALIYPSFPKTGRLELTFFIPQPKISLRSHLQNGPL